MKRNAFANASLVGLICGLSLLAAACSSQQRASSATEEEAAERQASAAQDAEDSVEKPTRIILMIGDGMGVPAISAASYAKGAPLSMLEMRSMGWMTTHSHEFVTTDSAASATALATGQKTHFEGVSVAAGTSKQAESDAGSHLETLLEKAERAGWRTGLVATTRIVHATPAAFASHRAHRGSYEGIAQDMYESGVDVLLGGGPRFFRERADGVDLLAEFEKDGYRLASSKNEILEASQVAEKLIGFPHDPDFPPAGDPSRAMTLAELTQSAIDVLDRDNDDGFFLMVEGSQIDWRGHDLDGEGVVKETLDFDQAVAAARAYANQRDDTLVVVTSDHETGGMAVLDSPYTEQFLKAVGGQERLAEETEWVSPNDGGAPPKVAAQVALGRGGADKAFGPAYADNDTLTTVFGHLSLASRGSCASAREFSAMHTPSFVPVFAEGTAAGYIAAADDNSELGRRLKSLIGTELVAAGDLKRVKREEASQEPHNIIVMVGDGMGVSSLTAAHYANGALAMRELPVQGLASTHAADRLVTDSAAGATALATGRRTNVGAVGMARVRDKLVPATSLLEKAERQGMATGLVTTTTLTHATPAAFYAHEPNRGDEAKIADAFVSLPDRIAGSDGIDLAFGAGSKIFGDGQIEKLEARGVTVEQGWSDELPAGNQLLRLLGEKGLAAASERMGDDDPATPTLRQMTRAALAHLSKSNEGFLLVVEGGQIDWAQHGMARDRELIDELVDFDESVAEALEFARRDGNTLLLVTADHDHTTSVIDDHYGFDDCGCAAAVECGGDFELEKLEAAVDKIPYNKGLRETSLQGRYAPLEISLQYAWLVQEGARRAGRPGSHSANFVPVFAFGPSSETFSGFSDLPQIGQTLLEAIER